MPKPTIYIDGQEGSTGLRIRELLDGRDDLDLSLIPVEERKNVETRRRFLDDADIAILCLPDDAAAEAIELVSSGSTRIIDTSTARRTDSDWVYGLPELNPKQRDTIKAGDRIANPGCYPVGFILAVRPLIEAGLIDAGTPLTVNAVSGYSGGGRRMIEAYQQASPVEPAGDAAIPLSLYGLEGAHKHVPEMHKFSLTRQSPLFVPSVDHRYCGMIVSTPIRAESFARSNVTKRQIWSVWNDAYGDEPFVNPVEPGSIDGTLRDGRFLDLDGCNLTNRIDLFVFGAEEVGLVLAGRQDNLGKGASGNTIQCMNLMLGFDETTGLTVD